MKKVLQVNKLYYPYTGGIEKVVQQLAEGLQDKVDMEVLVCRQRGRTMKERVHGIPVIRAGSLGVLFSLPISFSFLWQLRRLAKDKDIIQFHMPFPLGDLGYLLSGYKGKVVVWWHSDVVRQKTLMKFYRPIMEKFLKRADVIIVATRGHIDGSDYLPKYKDKCIIIPYGIDSAIERRADTYIERRADTYIEKKEDIPIEKGAVISSKEINILFVGRLVYYKGCDILLKAFCSVQGARLTIVGSGPLEDNLKKIASDNNISDKIEFVGSASEERLCKAFSECDVFVLPSIVKSEAFGLVQIEAMAYGKPVINTMLPSGVPYVSLDGITGLTIQPGDVKALADAMQWMADHPEQRLEMGRKARERVKKCYQMKDMLGSVLKVYEDQEE